MAWTDAQQAAIERAQQRMAGQDNWTDEQRAAIERARARVAQQQTPPVETPGAIGAVANATVRMGGRVAGLADAYQAEQLSKAAAAQEEMTRRENAGEMTWLDRVATWRPSWATPLETPEELRGLAAEHVTSQANRDQHLAQQYPMSARGQRGVQALSNAQTWGEAGSALLNQPLDILAGAVEVGIEQAPTMAAAAAATAATRNPTVGMAIMGASTYAQERFGQMSSVAQKYGYDLTDPVQARRAVNDDAFMAEQEARGETRGAVIALVDAMTFRAGGALFGETWKGQLGNVGLQIAGGAGGEAGAQYASTGQISSPGDVIMEGLAEGPFSAVELSMAHTRPREGSDSTGSNLDAKLASENAQLEAEQRLKAEADAAAQDLEARNTRLDYAPTFVSERDFNARQEEALRTDAVNPETETGKAFRQYLLNNDILPTNQQEQTTALNAFVKETQNGRDQNAAREEYRTALDEHIGRMRDLETVLNPNPAAEQQLEMNFDAPKADASAEATAEPAPQGEQQLELDIPQPAPKEPAVAEGSVRAYQGKDNTFTTTRPDAATNYVDVPSTDARAGEEQFTLTAEELDKLGGMKTLPVQQDEKAQALDPVRMVTEIIKATGTQVDANTEAAIAAQMAQVNALPAEQRVSAARALVAQYTSPKAKGKTATGAKTDTSTAAAAAKNDVAKVAPEITAETPVRRRQEGQAKADALLPANWTEDAKYDGVNSALNGKHFNIKKFNDALAAALNPQTETNTDAAPGTDAAPDDNTNVVRKALVAEANKKLGADWMAKHPDIVEDLAKNKLKAVETKITERAKPAENLPAAKSDQGTALAPEVIQKANLSGNEQKVFEVLMQAFQNNEQDAVLQADGSWNTAEIGKRAGVGTKTANTYITRTVNKIAKSLGATPEQMRTRLREAGIARRQGEAAPDINAPVSVFDTASLADGGSINTKASANQGARDGMSKEDAKYLDEKIANEPNPVADKRAADAAAKRESIVNEAITRSGRKALALWQTLTNDSGAKVPASKLSKADLTDWVLTVDEFEHGAITEDQVLEDHRAIERLYDATGGITQESVDEITKADEGRADQGGKTSGESSTAPEGDQGQRGAAESDRGARAGKPPRQSTVEDAEILSESNPTPKELRNQASFKDSYANKEGYTSGLWENPDLTDVAAYADWLGSLTQEQWDAINPAFTNDLNPFKNPMSIDPAAAKAKLEGIMNRPTADTGVVGQNKPAPKVEVKAKRKKITPPKFSVAEAEERAKGTTANNVHNAIQWLVGKAANWRTMVVKSPDDLISLVLSKELNISGLTLGEILDKANAHGVVVTDRDGVTRAFFFSDNITPGDERAVVMHEIGSHIGMDNVLTSEQLTTAVNKIREWAASDAKSLEKTLAERAMARLKGAQDADAVTDESSETLAYFLEEAVRAGVTPNSDSKSPLANFIRQIWADFKRALRKLRPENEAALTAQDLVNMARGAARLELATDFHGASGAFRKVNPDYFGLGNNAVGVGFYLSEDMETGAKYMVQRMQERNETGGVLQRIDTTVAEDEYLNWDARMADQPAMMEAFNKLPEEIQDTLLEDFGVESVDALTGRQFYIGLTQQQLRDYAIEGYIDDKSYDRAQRHKRQTTTAMAIVSAFLDANGIRGIKTQIKTNSGNPEAEFNKIIFNDKNVIVVGRNDAGDIDANSTVPGTVRFSVNNRAAQQNASRTEKFLERSLGGARSAQVVADTKAIIRRPIESTKFLHQFIRETRAEMPSAGRWYDAMLEQEQTTNEILARGEPIIQAYREMKADRQALVNDFIGTSTFFQKWGYDPKWQGRQVKVDPIMKTKFDRLRPEEQQLVRDVFQHGENMRLEMQDIAKKLGIPPKMFSMNSKLDGPYAPLKRFGDNVAVLRSQKLADMEARLRQNPQDKKLANDIEKLKGDGEHYIVSFFDTIGAAEKFAFENRQNYPVSDVSEKAPDTFGDRITNPEAFSKVISAIKADDKAGLDSTTRQAVTKIVEKLYYESLGEQNARLSGARRLNRAGYEKDMIRSFMSHLQAQARLVAQLKHGAEINTAFAEASREAGSNRRKLQPTFNMIARKYNRMLSTDRGVLASVQDNIAALNTVYMLTSNIGYHLTNAVQPMISVAKMAGDFAKYPGAWGAMLKGYMNSRHVVDSSMFRQVGTALTVGFVDMNNKVNIDVSKAPPKYRKLLETLQKRQLLDVGMEQDLNLEDRYDTGYDTLNKVSENFGNLTHRLYQVARYVEAHNRVASAIAAYDMATANPQTTQRMKMTPEEYAISVVQDTQGNFSNFDAPLVIDALPKVTTQYRKFQLMMAWLYGNAAKKAFRGADKFERAAGRRTLAVLVTHAAAMAGVGGIPMVSTLAPYVLAAMGGDDDDPTERDLELYIRENVFPNDPGMADLVTRGVPAFFGIDMSAKLSQGDIFWPVNLRYVDTSFNANGANNVLASTLLGPTSGNFTNLWKGAGLLAQGDLGRAAEMLSPRGVRSMLESYRYATEGYSLSNGDVVLDPRQIDTSSLLLNAIGLPPEEISHIKWTRGQQYELDQYFRTESGRLRDAYVEAFRNRDTETLASLRNDWRDLQMQKDRVRPFFHGSRMAPRRQPMSDLLSAPREQMRRERGYRDALGTRQ